MNYGPYVKNLRENKGFPQDFVAKKLGMSRPTYILIEKGGRELGIEEVKKLADLFGLSVEGFFNLEEPLKVDIKKNKLVVKTVPKQEERISVPQKNLTKFKEVLLYVLQKVGAKPNIGETALYKLLYFIDFDFYEKFEEQLVGATYTRNKYGPTPVEFPAIVREMQIKGEIEKVKSQFFQYDQKKYLPRRNADLSKLSALELSHIDEVLNRLSDKTAKELSDYSHTDIPWKVHKPGEVINYESVFYRDQEHSVRNYDDEL